MKLDEKALEAAVLAAPGKTTDECRAIAEPIVRAYLQALGSGSTGEAEGLVLVPKEPTEAMLVACVTALRGHLGDKLDDSAYDPDLIAQECLSSAMLAAAGGRDE